MVRAPMHQAPLPSVTHAALGLLPRRVALLREGVAPLLLAAMRSRSVVDLRREKADTEAPRSRLPLDPTFPRNSGELSILYPSSRSQK